MTNTPPNMRVHNGAAPQANKPAPKPAGNSRMSLKNRIAGRVQHAPIRVVLFGVEGVGKSTFGAGAPKPIFLGEEGSSQLAVDRFQTPHTWLEVLDAVRALKDEDHDRKTLVIDTLDWIEPLCWAHTCALKGKKDMDEFGFDKGPKAALEHWRVLLRAIDDLRREKGMGVVMLAHCHIRTFKNPDHEVGDYDRYELKLDKKAGGLIKEWSDAVMLANFETFAVKSDEDKRVRGVGKGERIVYTERRPAWDAKNRFGLPYRMPLSWDAFVDGIKTSAVDRTALLAEASKLIAQADDATATAARDWLANAGEKPDSSLVQFVDRLRSKLTLAPTDAPAAEQNEAAPAA